MRIDVKKYLFIGLDCDKEAFFREAQKMGLIHFQEKKRLSHPDVQLFTDAIKVLRGLPPLEQEERECNTHQIAKQIRDMKQAIEKAEEEIRILRLDIERISVFGDFSLEEITYLQDRHLKVQFFCSKKGTVPSDELIYIATKHGLDYFVSISKTPYSSEGMIEIKIDQSLNELNTLLKETELEKGEIEKFLQEMARYSHLLHQALLHALNCADLKEAETGAAPAFNDSLFTVVGWVPEDKVQELLKLNSIHVEEIGHEQNEVIPTYLENQSWGKVGEDIIGIYDTPSTQDKDPSLWVLFGFLVFFSIIIADGGYGSIFLGIALYIRYKHPLITGFNKRLLNLTTLLSIGCIVWGILSSSFFGMALSPENPLRSYSLVSYLAEKKAAYHVKEESQTYQNWVYKYPEIQEEKDPRHIIFKSSGAPELLATLSDEILLEISLFIGVIHLLIGLLRYLKRNWSHLGWVLFLIGGYLYFPVFLGVPSLLNYVFGVPYASGGEVGLQMIFVGIPLAVFLAIVRNGLVGFAEIMNLIQVFGDVLSYLRLYALGLSGAILSATINHLASSLPFVLAILIIVLGHIINMVLGIMGGVIHGLRLNFLEWYHYSFEGGGRKFKPLEIKEL